jgi:hypothetical protein
MLDESGWQPFSAVAGVQSETQINQQQTTTYKITSMLQQILFRNVFQKISGAQGKALVSQESQNSPIFCHIRSSDAASGP